MNNSCPDTNHVEVSLDLYGFKGLTHAEISARLGLEPNKIYVQGQPVNSRTLLRLSPVNRWLLVAHTDEGPYPDFEQQMDHLLALVSARWEAFEEVVDHCEGVEVKCAIFTYVGNGESTPWVHLERRHVAMLGRLGAGFDIDLYAFSSSKDDE